MARYYIVNYKKKSQSFLAGLNSMYENTGINERSRGIQEPYELYLLKVSFWGLLKSYEFKDVYLPKGFDHAKELVKGREWINN